jgi:hypothetical protein
MADEDVMRWYKHGEKASGIGLKCQLCGKRCAWLAGDVINDVITAQL